MDGDTAIETSGVGATSSTDAYVAGPYTMEVQPRSPNRVFLARAFSHFCALHRGLPDLEIERAFDLAEDASTVSYVQMTSGLLGDLLATGSIRSFARPFGGGEAVALPSSAWEIDDVRVRFALSAIDPFSPFDGDAAPTHWIFFDLNDWNDVVDASLADVRAAMPVTSVRAVKTIAVIEAAMSSAPPAAAPGDRLLRLPEVERRTGLSKSTIYRRIGSKRFPPSVPMTGNIALWRESDVADWIADPV